jgi:general secretion pathway protein A
MYEHFYGLTERPFSLTANLKYLLLTPKHQETLSSLEYGISNGNGITLVLGEAGTGKTTVLRKVFALHGQHPSFRAVRCAYLTNPRLSQADFLESLIHAFQLDPDAAIGKSRFLRELERRLVELKATGILPILVADEAQSLPDDLLEEVRLLANLETETEKLLRVVLAGQPTLGERLNQPHFRQLKQRIGLRCALPPLNLRETAVYIAHRISVAGGKPARIFSREAVITIYERSGGIPRTVNVICDNALLTGFAADQRPVDRDLVLEVCRDFDLEDRARPSETARVVPDPPAPIDRFHPGSKGIFRNIAAEPETAAAGAGRGFGLSFLRAKRS